MHLVLQKPVFHICWDYVDFGVIFIWFSMALEPFLMTFGGLGPGLKFYDLRWLSGGSRSWEPSPFGGIWVAFWSPFHQPNSFLELFNMQNTSWNMQEWRDTKKQDANYENTKNQGCNMPSLQRKIKAVICSHNNRGTRRTIEEMPRSLVAPLRGAGGFLMVWVVFRFLSSQAF